MGVLRRSYGSGNMSGSKPGRDAFSSSAPDRILIGLQLFQRFVVSIDFDRSTLTLTQPDHFT